MYALIGTFPFPVDEKGTHSVEIKTGRVFSIGHFEGGSVSRCHAKIILTGV